MVEVSDSAWHARTLGRDVLETRGDSVTLDQIVPNPNQPRQGPKLDLQLKKEIIENRGVFDPLLVEPHPDLIPPHATRNPCGSAGCERAA